MKMINDYPILSHWYKTLDWILNRTEKMPKHSRYSFNNRIASSSLDVLELLIETVYSKERKVILSKINLILEKLRFLFRICFDRRYISASQYRYISEQIDTAGRMCGGWMKSCEE
jgi:hypothetical protein